MLYFCPIHGIYLESPDNRYSNYREQVDGTIIDLWNTVSPPPAPVLKSVKTDSNTTALLILDMEMSICKSSRCIASITNISNLLTKARNNGMLVVYSLTHGGNPGDIVRQLTPLPGEPIVKSNVDKFYETNLDKTLREKDIKTVIVTGFAANGAVLHTAASAAFHGYNVIVPVDCMSTANILYAEQYTAWHILNSPATRNRALLTEASLISFTH